MENHNDFLKDWLEGKVSPAELKSREENGNALIREYDELITRSASLKVPDSGSRKTRGKNSRVN
jgi:hypothetical protein